MFYSTIALMKFPREMFCYFLGNVARVDLAEDPDRKSKGFGTVVFDTPMEALQAVCILFQIKK